MNRFLRLLLLSISLQIGIVASAQTDSCNLQISLLTCSPGEELYSTFGHTAIRVKDNTTGMDIVFNYGTFDASNPNFYYDFTKGLMRYALSAYPFTEFLEEYKYEGRGVIEQELLMTCPQKQTLFNALRNNLQPQNRFYNYYFHTDNCTTRARDMIADSAGSSVTYKNILPSEPPTFRNLLYEYLNKGQQYWSKFGIDLLLGANLDKRPTNKEAMFLPDYLLKGFDSASIDQHPLVGKKQTVLPAVTKETGTVWFTPLVACCILLVLAIALTLKANPNSKALLLFDSIFFLLLGLLGAVMATLWIIRIDTVCRNNLNLLWALPTHLVIAFVVGKKKNWVRKYFRFTLIIALLLAFTWFFLPQQLNTAVWPLLGIVILRSWKWSV
jgi:uncharacterized protein DUF4105